MAQSGAEYEELETLVVDGFTDNGTLIPRHICFNHRQVFGLRRVAGLLVLQSGEDIVIGIRSIIQLVRLVQARGIIDTVAEHDVEYVLILLRQIVREVDIVGKVLVLVVKPLLHTMYRLYPYMFF